MALHGHSFTTHRLADLAKFSIDHKVPQPYHLNMQVNAHTRHFFCLSPRSIHSCTSRAEHGPSLTDELEDSQQNRKPETLLHLDGSCNPNKASECPTTHLHRSLQGVHSQKHAYVYGKQATAHNCTERRAHRHNKLCKESLLERMTVHEFHSTLVCSISGSIFTVPQVPRVPRPEYIQHAYAASDWSTNDHAGTSEQNRLSSFHPTLHHWQCTCATHTYS